MQLLFTEKEERTTEREEKGRMDKVIWKAGKKYRLKSFHIMWRISTRITISERLSTMNFQTL